MVFHCVIPQSSNSSRKSHWSELNIARIANALISVSNVTSCWDCLCYCLCHCLCHCLCLFIGLCHRLWSGHAPLSLWSNVSLVTSLWGRSLKVFSKCICLCHCLFVGRVMSPHHCDQMSLSSQVSRFTLLLCF